MSTITVSLLLEGFFAALAIGILTAVVCTQYRMSNKKALLNGALLAAAASLLNTILEIIRTLFGYPPQPSLFVLLAGFAYLIVFAARKNASLARVPVPVRTDEDKK